MGGTAELLGGHGVTDCADGQLVGGVPGTGPPVQLRHLVGVLGEQARAEHVGEQVVVAVPGALVVEGDDEQIAALELLQHAPAVVAGGDGIAETPGEVVEDGGAEQEVADLVWLACENFVGEVVDDEAVAPRERLDEVRHFLVLTDAAQRERRELEASDPALGALLQRADVVVAEVEPHHPVEELQRPQVA